MEYILSSDLENKSQEDSLCILWNVENCHGSGSTNEKIHKPKSTALAA